MTEHTSPRPPRLLRAVLALAVVVALMANAPAASAAQSKTWGWTTDSYVMSFFGGIPFRGCEMAKLTVPNSGSTGTITVTAWSSIVVGFANCSSSTVPSSLPADTIRVRAQLTRNGILQAGCDTFTVLNSAGQGVVSATDTCTKTSSEDATWRLLGTYGWWDYDDGVWRGESMSQPVIVD